MTNNTIAIVLCFYNNADTLQKTLSSLVYQTYKNFVCFMIDDGSIDSSTDIAKTFSSTDERFRYFKLEHSGPGACRNFALEHVYSGGYRYLAFIDADDFYAINKLEIQINELNLDETISLVASSSRNLILDDYMKLDFNCVQSYRKEKFEDSFFELMQTNFRFHPASSLIDLSRVSVRPFNSNDVSGQDYKFFLDLFYDSPKKLVLYADLYTCSVRINSVQRRGDARLKSAIARYNATLFYLDVIKEIDSQRKVLSSLDRYLSWIGHQTQLYNGYLDGIKVSLEQFPLYNNKFYFFVALVKRSLNLKTVRNIH